MNLKSVFGFVFGIVVGVILTTTVVVNAGNLAGPDKSPGETESYSLADIYHSINSGQAAEISTFTEPAAGPDTPTMFSLDEIYELTRVRAPIRKTGQTVSYFEWDDGDHQAGVAWPVPRFTDNGDGTVTDHLTGLIWLKDADCWGAKRWEYALSDIKSLESGECGLQDGSVAGDWRLPNLLEMQSLIHYGLSNPAIPNTQGTGKWDQGDPFDNVRSETVRLDYYWTSTTNPYYTSYKFAIDLLDGFITSIYIDESEYYYFWPVRGGQ